jgi:hypothetical protein
MRDLAGQGNVPHFCISRLDVAPETVSVEKNVSHAAGKPAPEGLKQGELTRQPQRQAS